MDELTQLIYWTDKGREGAAHIRQRIQQKQMAERMAAAAGDGMTVKEAQKIISESLEIQKKANAARAVTYSAPTNRGINNPKKRGRSHYSGGGRGTDRRRSNAKFRSGPSNGPREHADRYNRFKKSGRAYRKCEAHAPTTNTRVEDARSYTTPVKPPACRAQGTEAEVRRPRLSRKRARHTARTQVAPTGSQGQIEESKGNSLEEKLTEENKNDIKLDQPSLAALLAASVDENWFAKPQNISSHQDAVDELHNAIPEVQQRTLKKDRSVFSNPVHIEDHVLEQWPMGSTEKAPIPPPWPTKKERKEMERESSNRDAGTPLGPKASRWVDDLKKWYTSLQQHFEFDATDLASNVRRSVNRWRTRLRYLKQQNPE